MAAEVTPDDLSCSTCVGATGKDTTQPCTYRIVSKICRASCQSTSMGTMRTQLLQEFEAELTCLNRVDIQSNLSTCSSLMLHFSFSMHSCDCRYLMAVWRAPMAEGTELCKQADTALSSYAALNNTALVQACSAQQVPKLTGALYNACSLLLVQVCFHIKVRRGCR